MLFEKVDNTLDRLQLNGKSNVKVNTIISKENIQYINDIKEYIEKFTIINRWSLYQFFPLSAAKKNESRFSITNEEFDTVTKDLHFNNKKCKVELLKFNSRVNGYLFCDEEGNAYTNNIQGEYINLFSFFDPNIKIHLSNLNDLINPKIMSRYQ